MRRLKLLAVPSAVGLGLPYGCTPAWWQLWKALSESGVDVIVTPYRGQPVDSLWWRTYPNPCANEGAVFAAARKTMGHLGFPARPSLDQDRVDGSKYDQLFREFVWRWITPRWERHLTEILERERDIDAVIMFTPPSTHFRGIPTMLRERFDVPVIYYDGDIPMSLPEYGGMDTGFDPANGGDPAEYDLVLSNSEGGLPRLLELGARRAEALFWGADPELFKPIPVEKKYDVFFYGIGDTFRQEWIEKLVGEPSRRLPDVDFALGGRSPNLVGNARPIGPVPLNVFARVISASRLCLNITRGPHGTVYASSTCRPFELAASGAAIVSGPHNGIERWFEPGQELRLVSGTNDAIEAYEELLADPGTALAMGQRARERVLDEHTYRHRARQLLELLDLTTPDGFKPGHEPESADATARSATITAASEALGQPLLLKSRAYYVASRIYQRARIRHAQRRSLVLPTSGIRVLGYHRITSANDVLATSPREFRRQMEWMLEAGFSPIRLADAIDLLKGPVERLFFCVTFDDGYHDLLDHGVRILRDLEIPGTVFVPTLMIDRQMPFYWYEHPPRALSWDELRDLVSDGTVDVQSHGRTHYPLPSLSDSDAEVEIFTSKSEIEQQLGYPLTSFCYPAGRYGPREAALVQQAGYRAAITTNPGINSGGESCDALSRTMVYWRDTLADFSAKARGALDETTRLQQFVRFHRL